ncbi:hypothetical protein [Helicobacter pylori]|uniref:hypothetical protein n=1 Tax=Helicobacter pylori TaxID=210 RepID=UPI00165A8C39|nr:hypothetical protein [Helicobacter pylori]
MKLFDKWQSVTEDYESFSEEVKILAKEVCFFLEYLTQTDDSFKNAILKMFESYCDSFIILVKEVESIDDYFLVTQDNDSKLITGLRISENYLKAEIDKADIIHSFIPQDS